MRTGRFILIGLCGLVIFGLERAIILGFEPGQSLKIAAGFLSLFFFPGICLAEIFLKNEEADFMDRLALGFLLSLALFGFPGLAAFHYQWSLEKVFAIFFGLAVLAWIFSLAKLFLEPAPQPAAKEADLGRWMALALVISSGAIAWFVGASRGPEHDWDLYNYISMVRKFLVWDQAGIHHYFYADAPPDPIHSYNLHALVWAVIAFRNRVDPIPLYIHSAFLTAPLCFAGFFSMARKALGNRAGFFAFAFYFFFQLIYGGLYFVGNSTFYPDDAMWLLGFPALLSLAFICLEKSSGRAALLAAFSALSVSVIHPLWGLAFYMVLGFLVAAEAKVGFSFLKEIWSAQKEQKAKAPFFYLMMALVYLPYLMSAGYVMAKVMQKPRLWFTPLIPAFAWDKLWIYAAIFILAPLILLLLISPWKKIADNFKASEFYSKGYFRRALVLMAVSLLIAMPYVYLRSQAIQSTQWQSFGRNPYRGLITTNLFLLNPFQRSFADPNMTFHPLFWLGLILSPWLYKLGRSKSRVSALAGFWGLIGVVLLVLHPVAASIFAKFFTLGYLRRILRLAAILSFLPLGAFLESLSSRFKIKGAYAYAGCLILSIGISFALIPAPAEPLYQGLLKRMVILARPQNRDTLMSDDTPFRFLAEHKLAGPDSVIFSDLYTSFRATAYLGCYVAVQAKPGVGVADQDQRRKDELEFFAASTSLERMREILLKYKANLIIINRNPQYQFYGFPLSHPEAIGKLTSLPEEYDKIFDDDEWVIFQVL